MKPGSTVKRIPTERAQRPVSRLKFVLAVGITLATSLALLVQGLRGVPTEEFGYFPHLLIVLVVAISVVASLAVTSIIPWHSRSLREWARPKVLGSFIALIMGSLALAAGLVPLFNPPAATEKTVSDINRRLEEAGVAAGEGSLIERAIAGRWGEPGCAVTYDIRQTQGHLSITSHRSVAGQRPLHLELQTEPGRGSRLVASVIHPLDQRGEQHEFVYERAGPQAFLTWARKKHEISLKLDHCP